MLSTVARSMFDVAPAHGARAPTAGTGKSYIFDLVAAIQLGERCPVISVAGKSEEETEKRIISKALAGEQIINIDNVNGTLGGDTLCQLIERPTCELRPLGVSTKIRVENRFVVFFNGNNCRVLGDMTRRVLTADLDARMEKPAERKFKSDPVAAILANRAKYIAACITVLRGYIVAGRLDQKLTPMNSFGEWSGTVRSSLVWLGRADPYETTAKAREDDPELQMLTALVAAIEPHADSSKNAISVGKLIEISEKVYDAGSKMAPLYPELHEILQDFVDRGTRPNPRRLGQWLKRFKGRMVSGAAGLMCIASLRNMHTKVENWYIETTAHPQPV